MSFEETLQQLLEKALEPLQKEIADLRQQIKIQNHDEVLTIKQAAKVLKISETTMYEVAKNPTFPGFRTSDSPKAHIKIPRDAFFKWINEHYDQIA